MILRLINDEIEIHADGPDYDAIRVDIARAAATEYVAHIKTASKYAEASQALAGYQIWRDCLATAEHVAGMHGEQWVRFHRPSDCTHCEWPDTTPATTGEAGEATSSDD